MRAARTEPRLVDLVYDGAFAQAIERAHSFAPHEVHTQLFLDDERHLEDAGPCDEFLRAWIDSIEFPFLRAEAADAFARCYTTELAPVPNGEYIGAYLLTRALHDALARVIEVILGDELKDLEETPRHPLSAESAARWRAVGRALAELDLPPAVSPVAPGGGGGGGGEREMASRTTRGERRQTNGSDGLVAVAQGAPSGDELIATADTPKNGPKSRHIPGVRSSLQWGVAFAVIPRRL
ncbi:hypothetical protein KZC52_07275 [Microbacterium sp. kSW2-24]|uniref:hypothetical protein n=1 Tax=Microbacterium galbinum TaxID=2851646 RepID=UPI001FFD3879|nr:hypothetical protein [Microbacterium galbinum]MCK2022719.1 hypothetical protein [Microbacterium galbinum]